MKLLSFILFSLGCVSATEENEVVLTALEEVNEALATVFFSKDENIEFFNVSHIWAQNMTVDQKSRLDLAGFNFTAAEENQKNMAAEIEKIAGLWGENGELPVCNKSAAGTDCMNWSSAHCITLQTGMQPDANGQPRFFAYKDNTYVDSRRVFLSRGQAFHLCTSYFDEVTIRGETDDEWRGQVLVNGKALKPQNTSGEIVVDRAVSLSSVNENDWKNDVDDFACIGSKNDLKYCTLWKESEPTISGKHDWSQLNDGVPLVGNQCAPKDNGMSGAYDMETLEPIDRPGCFVGQGMDNFARCNCLEDGDLTILGALYSQMVLENSSSSMAYSALLMLSMWLLH